MFLHGCLSRKYRIDLQHCLERLPEIHLWHSKERNFKLRKSEANHFQTDILITLYKYSFVGDKNAYKKRV